MTKVTKSSAKDGKAAESKHQEMDWHELLMEAVLEPGQLAKAYNFFHEYSFCNRFLAACQLKKRGQELQPIATFNDWKKHNRIVQKGEKALALVAPAPVYGTHKNERGEEEKVVLFTRFSLRNKWFSLAQTAGDAFEAPAPVKAGQWSEVLACEELSLSRYEFKLRSVGDARFGECDRRSFAVSPYAPHPELEAFRQMAHIVMEHTNESSRKAPADPLERAMEADCATYLVGATLGISGLEDVRERVRLYLSDMSRTIIPARCINRAFGAADKLLNSGY